MVAHAVDFIEDPLTVARRPEGPGEGHRAIGVGDAGHFGKQADFGPAQAPGIATAIDPLVVLEDDVPGRPGNANLVGEDFATEFDMAAHMVAFAAREASRLLDDVGRQVDVTDILQQSTKAERVQVIRRQAEVAAEGHQVHRGVQRVVVGQVVGLLEFGQPEQGIGIADDALDQPVDGVFQVFDIWQAPGRDLFADILQQVAGLGEGGAGARQFLLDADILVVVDDREAPAGHLADGPHGQGRQGQAAGIRVDDQRCRSGLPLVRTDIAAGVGAVLIADGAFAVDRDEAAELAQGVQIRLIVEQETLQQEGGSQPGAIKVRNEHPQPQPLS